MTNLQDFLLLLSGTHRIHHNFLKAIRHVIVIYLAQLRVRLRILLRSSMPLLHLANDSASAAHRCFWRWVGCRRRVPWRTAPEGSLRQPELLIKVGTATRDEAINDNLLYPWFNFRNLLEATFARHAGSLPPITYRNGTSQARRASVMLNSREFPQSLP